jgi:DNA-binding MarR family transcriptional regulator
MSEARHALTYRQQRCLGALTETFRSVREIARATDLPITAVAYSLTRLADLGLCEKQETHDRIDAGRGRTRIVKVVAFRRVRELEAA